MLQQLPVSTHRNYTWVLAAAHLFLLHLAVEAIGIGSDVSTGHERPKVLLVDDLAASERHGGHGAAVEAALTRVLHRVQAKGCDTERGRK